MKLYRVNALLLKYWYMSVNNIDRFFDIFYWPLIGIIVFGFTAGFIKDISNLPEILVFLLGGMILWTLIERVQQDVTIYVLHDFWSHNLANSFVTPVKESEIFVSICIVGLIRSFLTFLVMAGFALVGYKFNLITGGFASLLFIPPLFIFGWGLGIFISGLIFKYGLRVQIFAWSISFLLQPLAAVYYPITVLPLILQKIAYYFPLVYVFEGFRMAYAGALNYSYLAAAYGLSVLYMIIGYIVFSISIKSAKKTGELVKY